MVATTESDRPMPPADTDQPEDSRSPSRGDRKDNRSSRDNKRKRGGNSSLQHGARNKNRDMGRGEYFNQQLDKRGSNEERKAKRQKLEGEGKYANYLPTAFSKEEIAAEDRRPKRKVAVMIGYSGTGYRGMQIMPDQPTIEGDLFAAFVAAGAISKANADDPKKSGLVRCARTDKGVHAAGNVVSLKLIVEDEDVVEKINSNLSPQIRIWGIERTVGSFSCYQACDSRWYEYLLPTHTLLPPHPNSFLGKKLFELAQEANDLDGYHARQEEVKDFWAEAEKKYIQPILEELDEETRKKVQEALYESEAEPENADEDLKEVAAKVADAADIKDVSDSKEDMAMAETAPESQPASEIKAAPEPKPTKQIDPATQALRDATKRLKAAYLTARKAYRVPQARLDRLQSALDSYVGTHNFHNFTIRKSAKDPSTKRHIKSFVVNMTPIIKHGTEWVSLKVHGQSFMMHQIRKMVGLAALVVRCGCPIERMDETMTETVISIPKAPSLGLLLERPVFDSYNTNVAPKNEREPIDFSKYEKEMLAFKDREIYERMFMVEEEEGVFSNFFAHLDAYKESFFLYLTSGGLKAAGDERKARTTRGGKVFGEESDDEGVRGGEEG